MGLFHRYSSEDRQDFVRWRSSGAWRSSGDQPERLLVTPEADPQKTGRFTARLERTGEIIVRGTRQPLVDGARELIARGFNAATLLTMRLEGKAEDAFQPAPIAQWAKWTYEEGDRDGLRRVRWRPRQLHAEGQKWGVVPPEGLEATPAEIRFHDGTPQHGSERELETR